MNKKAIFITARLGSSRLPKKHIKKINGRFCIDLMIERIKRSKLADVVVLCTTNLSEDDTLCDIAKLHDIEIYRGSVKDKLQRWLGAALKHNVEFFVTADADDLFCEPQLIDLAFEQYDRSKEDFIEWDQEKLICGAFTYGIKTDALSAVCESKNTDDTEMMWVFFDPKIFNIKKLANVPVVFNRPDIRATLDYQEDFEFFKAIYRHFGDNNFSLYDVVKLLNKFPNIVEINSAKHKDWKENQEKRIGKL